MKLTRPFSVVFLFLVCCGCSIKSKNCCDPEKVASLPVGTKTDDPSHEISSFKKFELPKTKVGKLFILSAPSGTGKTTIADMLLKNLSNFKRAVTTTTRKPRAGEVNGIDYHFVTPDVFREMKGRGEFLESVQQYGNEYGTAKKDVDALLSHGTHVLLVIDTQGAKAIAAMIPDAVLIFLKPPSLQELEKRLKGRGSEDEESLSRRLLKVKDELLDEKYFQYSVTNDELDRAYQAVSSIIIAECFRSAKN